MDQSGRAVCHCSTDKTPFPRLTLAPPERLIVRDMLGNIPVLFFCHEHPGFRTLLPVTGTAGATGTPVPIGMACLIGPTVRLGTPPHDAYSILRCKPRAACWGMTTGPQKCLKYPMEPRGEAPFDRLRGPASGQRLPISRAASPPGIDAPSRGVGPSETPPGMPLRTLPPGR